MARTTRKAPAKKPPSSAAAALLARLGDDLLAAIQPSPSAADAAPRAEVRKILVALRPHRDDAAVVRRALVVLRKGGDYTLVEAAAAIVMKSKLPEAAEMVFGELAGPRTIARDAAVIRLLELPVPDALRRLAGLRKPANHGALGDILFRMYVGFPRRNRLSALHRHPKFLDLCASLRSTPLATSAATLLALAGDARALPPLRKAITGGSPDERMFALHRLSELDDAKAIPDLERHLARTDLPPIEVTVAKKVLARLAKTRPPARRAPPRVRPATKPLRVSVAPARTPAPARLHEDDGSFTLTFDDFAPSAAIFDKHGKDGGGHGWAAVIDALLRTYSPRTLAKLELDPEASMFTATSKQRLPLLIVATLLRQALRSPALLEQAIQRADPDLLD